MRQPWDWVLPSRTDSCGWQPIVAGKAVAFAVACEHFLRWAWQTGPGVLRVVTMASIPGLPLKREPLEAVLVHLGLLCCSCKTRPRLTLAPPKRPTPSGARLEAVVAEAAMMSKIQISLMNENENYKS